MRHDAPTHLDIFSGIGGFAIAAQWAGFETVGFCESDSRCRTFLEKTWGKPVHADIRTFDAKPYRGVSLLTGGPPCQPASRAGKQGGEGDDRWLWPEALRVLEEAKPDCVVFENPPGILDVGIDGILSEMGRVGYEVQPFDIPACAVDSPQLRHRFWFVGFLADTTSRGQRTDGSTPGRYGHADERDKGSLLANTDRNRHRERRAESRAGISGRDCQDQPNAIQDAVRDSQLADTSRDSERGIRTQAGADSERTRQPCEPDSGGMADPRRERSGQDEQGRRPDRRAVDRRDCADDVADSENLHGRREQQPGQPATDWRSRPSRSTWQNSVWVPCADGKLRRAPDDSFGLVDGLHRSLLAALGNSICPEVAYQILRAVRPLIEI